MNEISSALTAIYNRIPRRHSTENLAEMKTLLMDYEDILVEVEAINSFYERSVPEFFEHLETVNASLKKSNDNKASKKMKDVYFDEAADILKDSVEGMIALYGDGKRTG